jgi:restriction system protein
MAKRKWRSHSSEDGIEDALEPLFVLFVLGLIGFIYTYRQQIITYGIIADVVIVLGFVGYLFWRKQRKAAILKVDLDDERTLCMLRGMTPSQFEHEMARMFTALGYSAEVVGGANDHGIDVVAHKDGKKYYIQCKRFMHTEVTPHDVRDFLGAIKDIDHPAEMGFLITTNKFTLAAKKAAEGDPRIEPVDAIRLVEYYKMAQGKMPTEPHMPEPQAPAPQANTKHCPRCGGNLALRTAHKGEHAGHQFWGCSNYPKCTYLENIQENVAVH